MYGVEFFEHTVCEDKRLSGIHEYGLDYLPINRESPFARQSAMLEEGGKDFTCM